MLENTLLVSSHPHPSTILVEAVGLPPEILPEILPDILPEILPDTLPDPIFPDREVDCDLVMAIVSFFPASFPVSVLMYGCGWKYKRRTASSGQLILESEGLAWLQLAAISHTFGLCKCICHDLLDKADLSVIGTCKELCHGSQEPGEERRRMDEAKNGEGG